MGVMPEDRSRRLHSLLRRFGIAGEGNPEREETQNAGDKIEELRKNAADALLPGLPRHKDKAERSRKR